MYKTFKKMVATLLVVIMAFSYLQVIGVYVSKVYAADLRLEKQETTTNISNVEFDAYFKVDENNIHTATKKISEDNLIYVRVKVKDAGYLKEGQIKVKGSSDESANFNVLGVENPACQSVNENIIKLNNIENGSDIILELPIKFIQGEDMNLNNFSKENELELTGTYIDANGNERKVKKAIKVQLNWEDEAEAEISQVITRYVPYQVEEEKGIVLQTTIQTSIKDNKLPLKQSKLEVLVPIINGNMPSKTKITANTLATNGGSRTLNEDEYTYNEETGMLEIITQNNPSEDGKISWKKNVKDEYIITCVFDSQALDSVAPEGVNVSLGSKVEMQVYGSNQNTLNAEVPVTENLLTEKINDIVLAGTVSTESLSKAFLYANIKASAENKNETQYKQNIAVNISYVDLVDELKVSIRPDLYTFTDERDYLSGSSTYIKDIYLSRENYIDLFGEDGTITIETAEGNPITIIGKETEADSNGNIVVELSDMVIDQLVVRTSKPQKEGTLSIYVDKAIKSNANLVQIENYKNIKSDIVVETIKDQMSIISQAVTASTTLVEPVSKIDVQINTETLSTVVENKNVELRAVLDISDRNYALYTNPVIDFVLPEYVENITINSVELMFNDELKIEKYELIAPRTIRVTISGEQTKYDIGSVARGANVILDLNIRARQLTPTINSEIKMYVQNANNNIFENVEEGRGVDTTPIKFVAPVGLVAANSISNYNSQNQKLLLISGENQVGKLDVLSASTRVALVENTVINNSTAPINNVNILGRIIAKGATDLQSGEDLGTTFDAVMKSGIAVEGIDNSMVTVYYSENASATNDLNNPGNGWTTEVTDLTKIKSYLVVLNNYQMEIGTIISLKYNVEIPSALSRNNYGYTNYAVYYNTVNEGIATVSNAQERLIAPIAEVSTGEGPELKVTIESNVEANADVYEGQIIKYGVRVTNTGKTKLEGVIAGADIPKGTTYIEYKAGLIEEETDSYREDPSKTKVMGTLGEIPVGQSKVFEFEVKVNKMIEIPDDTHNHDEIGEIITDVKAKGFATANELEAIAESENELSNKIVKGFMSTTLITEPGSGMVLNGDAPLTYKFTIENLNERLTDIVVKDTLPEGLIFKEAYYTINMINTAGNYNEQTREITYNIPTINEEEIIDIYLVADLDQTRYGESEFRNSMRVSFKTSNGDVRSLISNEVINKANIEKAEMEVKLTSDIPQGTVEEGELITYIFELKNTGTKDLQNIAIVSVFPSVLSFVSSKYVINGEETEIGGTTSNNVRLTANLPAGTSLMYSITLQAEELEDGAESVQTQIKFMAYNTDVGQMTTDTITHTIVPSTVDPNNPDDPDNPDNPGSSTLKRIQGQVWIDTNEDGKKDESEPRVKDVKVLLFSYTEKSLVADSQGNAIIKTTDSNGNYEFTSLPRGDYSVIFLYDVANYSATEYRKEDVSDILNSDIIDSRITLDGEERIAGLTERIKLSTSNAYNIDAGLVEDKKFDLKLDKTVASITVQNQTGTAKYEYNNKLAKRDLTGAYLEETTIVVEYKISIINEGAIEGYAKKIVDYIPSNFKFNAELNRDWYMADDGSVCSSSLANTKIQPGETKEITLLLTKTVKESDLTIISNTAEILEAYNDLGVADVDSTPGNKQSNEDDTSTADILLTVRTGAEIAMFIGLTIAIVAIIGVGVYFINKKVLRRVR